MLLKKEIILIRNIHLTDDIMDRLQEQPYIAYVCVYMSVFIYVRLQYVLSKCSEILLFCWEIKIGESSGLWIENLDNNTDFTTILRVTLGKSQTLLTFHTYKIGIIIKALWWQATYTKIMVKDWILDVVKRLPLLHISLHTHISCITF